MKKYIAIAGLLLIVATGHAQDLVQLRYYFNQTAENLTYISIGSVQALDADFEINIAGLPQGVHQLYIEIQNSEGVWTHYDRIPIQVVGGLSMFTLNSFEYFFDQDPGFGNGIQVAISGSTYEGDIPLSLAGLSNGIHTVYYRMKDNANQWTHYDSQLIQVTAGGYEELVRLEYFFDVDPGQGNAPGINFDQTPTLDIEADIDVPEFLTLGQHILYVRMQDTSGQWSHYGQDTLIVCDISTPTIIQSGSLCAGDTLQLSVPENYVSYTWSTGSQTNSTSITESGTYQLTVADDDCAITVTTTVSFIELPIPMITADGNVMSVEEGEYSYQWTFNGESNKEDNGPTFEGTENGIATVTIYSGDCSITSEPYEFNYIGIEENGIIPFSLFPNPTTGVLNLYSEMSGQLVIYDATGKQVIHESLSGKLRTLNLTSLSGGIYVVQFICNEGNYTRQLQLNH